MGEVRTVGVVGLGAMGAGIAQLAVEAGYDVVGREVTPELGEAAAARIAGFLRRKVEKGQLESDACEAAIGRLRTTADLSDVDYGASVSDAARSARIGALVLLPTLIGSS